MSNSEVLFFPLTGCPEMSKLFPGILDYDFDHEDAVFPALYSGNERLCRLPQLWLQPERAAQADPDAAILSAAYCLDLHTVLNIEAE